MPANDSNTNRVITILIHSYKTLFQIVFVTLLRRVAKDVTSSQLSWNKRYDFKVSHSYRIWNVFAQPEVASEVRRTSHFVTSDVVNYPLR